MKSGFVSLIGRSNVGKSTLINQLVSHKIAITSNKSQTTRNIIQGVYNDKETQIVFIDTPGIHKPINKLGKIMNKQSSAFIHDVDVIYFLVDASVPYGKGDQFIIDKLKDNDIPIILVLNKISLCGELKKTAQKVTLKLGKRGAIKNYIVRFVHTKDGGLKYRVTIVGTAQNGFELAFDPEKATVIDAEFVAGSLDAEGTKLILEEELQAKA